MLSPTDSALLKIAQDRGYISSADMMELVNYKVKKAPAASLCELLVQRGFVSQAGVAELVAQVAKTDPRSASNRFSPMAGMTPGTGRQTRTSRPASLMPGPPPPAPPPPPPPAPPAPPAALREGGTAADSDFHWPLQAGDRLGSYRVIDLLGKGGMGQVFRVRHEKLERDYALKVLLPGTASNPRLLARFRHEARATARLRHPNIVAVHEVGEAHGVHFFTMDLIEGQPLNTRVSTGMLDVRASVEMVRKIAAALHHAHREGVIHRDLKPSNIIVADEDDEPYLMDFGLAKELHAKTQLTRTGTAVGTLAYMPPEQLQGYKDLIGPKSDIYSLGVTLYECLTRRLPFVAETAPSLISKVINDEAIPPMRRKAEIPEPVSLICMKAMAKDPARRYGTALDFCRDLEHFLDGEPISAQRTSLWEMALVRARKNKPAATLAIVLFLVLMVFGVWQLKQTILARRAFSQRLGEAEQAYRTERWSDAMGLYGALIGQNPSDPRPYLGLERSRAALEARNLEEAAERVREGKRLLQVLRQLEVIVQADRETIRDLGQWIDPAAPVEDKLLLFRVRTQLRERQQEVIQLRAQALACFHQARGLDRSNDEAREQLASLYLEEYRHAERVGDLERLPFFAAMVETYNQRQPGQTAGGSLELRSSPPGAEVYMFRFNDRALDLRRVAVPWHPETGEAGAGEGEPAWAAADGEDPLWLGSANRLGSTPLPSTPLPQGSYLLVLRHPGKRDVRLPVAIALNTHWNSNVKLYADAEIGADFVYVPEGRASLGGDRDAFQPMGGGDANDLEVPGFFLARHEVTRGEYLRFLQAQGLAASDSLRLVPRSADFASPQWNRDAQGGWQLVGDPRLPVSSISHEDAEAYCAWRSQLDGRSYRLPRSEEWEKAARGVDGRFFIWGNEFEPSYSLNGFGYAEGRPLEPVGSYSTDISVYGVADMAGSLREFCSGNFEIEDLPLYGRRADSLIEVRGGAFSYVTQVSYLRLCTRLAYPSTRVREFFGFRLARAAE